MTRSVSADVEKIQAFVNSSERASSGRAGLWKGHAYLINPFQCHRRNQVIAVKKNLLLKDLEIVICQ